MRFLPPSTNDQYRGSILSAWYLTLVAITEFVPGCIHYFLPDGGAGVIAHIDLSTRRETIVAVFAWVGALQIPVGLMILLVSVRYRAMVPLFLAMVIVERGLMAFDGWFGKASTTGHHPPEHYGSVAAVALGLVFLMLSLRARKT